MTNVQDERDRLAGDWKRRGVIRHLEPRKCTCGHRTTLVHRVTGLCYECWLMEKKRHDKEEQQRQSGIQ